MSDYDKHCWEEWERWGYEQWCWEQEQEYCVEIDLGHIHNKDNKDKLQSYSLIIFKNKFKNNSYYKDQRTHHSLDYEFLEEVRRLEKMVGNQKYQEVDYMSYNNNSVGYEYSYGKGYWKPVMWDEEDYETWEMEDELGYWESYGWESSNGDWEDY